MNSNTTDTLAQYVIRKDRRTGQVGRSGVVIATKIGDNKVALGWSMANNSVHRYDKYDPVRGMSIARGRAMNTTRGKAVAPWAAQIYLDMVDRATRYFKGCEIIHIHDRSTVPIKHIEMREFKDLIPQTTNT